ncbi:MAG TPA: hypothetical protein VNW30_01985 [Opitutaceae bacterium]|nr:hypothetical protein [Opitutaceae bacterium]
MSTLLVTACTTKTPEPPVGIAIVTLTASEEDVRAALLSRFPIDMPIADFRSALVSEHLHDVEERDHLEGTPFLDRKLDGTRLIRVQIGSYRAYPGYVFVTAVFGFLDGYLVDCTIFKDYSRYDSWPEVIGLMIRLPAAEKTPSK